MLFSWNQLTDYLRLAIAHEDLADRLSLVGFNHESTREVGGDLGIDLEITSNRADCLSHLGIAREIGLLLGQAPTFPAPAEPSVRADGERQIRVENRAPDLCSRFEAITVHGTRVGRSPAWLARRLETLGVRSINNVVDATNYVMHESGQPIHAYDLDKLAGGALIIRRALPGEATEALNHQQYKLEGSMLVIADERAVVSLAGVMGCANSEIGAATTSIAIETARFDPISVRRTSRALGLQSQSSYRMERPIDPEMVIWARNRCVELILEAGGGSVGTADRFAAPDPPTRPAVTLRIEQVARLLGIEIDPAEMQRILVSLGLRLTRDEPNRWTFEPPSWRTDLDREVDLIEEVGRIHNYDQIPEDRPVRLGAIGQDRRGRVEGDVRSTLTGLGFSEAITYSFVAPELVGGQFVPGPPVEPIRVEHATRKQSNLMRLSLTPSLLDVVSSNEAHGNFGVRLFEIANVYRAVAGQDLPAESARLALVAPGDFFGVKGILEALLARLHVPNSLRWEPGSFEGLRPGHAARIWSGADFFGFAGEVAAAAAVRLKLRGTYSILEVSVDQLDAQANLIPQHEPTPLFPAVHRDLSLVVPNRMTWERIESAVRQVAGPTFEGLSFADAFRGGNLARDEQSIHFGLRFRNPSKTMTGEEIEASMARIVAHCRQELGATVRS